MYFVCGRSVDLFFNLTTAFVTLGQSTQNTSSTRWNIFSWKVNELNVIYEERKNFESRSMIIINNFI
jgi:hypothetical protein